MPAILDKQLLSDEDAADKEEQGETSKVLTDEEHDEQDSGRLRPVAAAPVGYTGGQGTEAEDVDSQSELSEGEDALPSAQDMERWYRRLGAQRGFYGTPEGYSQVEDFWLGWLEEAAGRGVCWLLDRLEDERHVVTLDRAASILADYDPPVVQEEIFSRLGEPGTRLSVEYVEILLQIVEWQDTPLRDNHRAVLVSLAGDDRVEVSKWARELIGEM